MIEQIKAPEIIQLSNEEIANPSDAQFKTLVLRMLTELVEFGHKLDEKMKKNFPNLAKEIDFQEVQEAQRVPKKPDPRRNTPRHIIITLAKIKDKERILKVAREKDTVTYKGVPIRNLVGKKGLERSIHSHERQGPTSEVILPSKAII